MEMEVWQRWLQQPQRLWVRKALFQVHLWVGLGIGLYVLVISISGSAIVYNQEIARRYSRKTVTLVMTESRRPMSLDELTRRVQQAYRTYEVDNVVEPQRADQPYDFVLERRNKRIERLFDPYTGADLGDPQSGINHVIEWLVDLHDNLLSGQTGRLANGIGSCFLTLLSLTGAVIWWPGIKNWRRSTTVSWKAHFPRFNWDLHSAIGFWCWVFVLIWGVSGICFCFPGPLSPVVGGDLRYWISRLHEGRFNGFTEALWTLLGLVPAVLFVTGALMWWNRALRNRFLQRVR